IGKLRLVGVYDDRVEGFFMLRTRIPGGHLTADQARVIGEVSERFSRRPDGFEYEDRFVELTTRQDIQLHWIRIEDLPEIWKNYARVGLTTLEACGNTTRNIVCCPAHGISKDETIDVYPIVREVTEHLLHSPDCSAFLPRKFKTAITGSKEDCVLALINDIAFTPASLRGELGFNVWVGGGLSDYPRLASPLNLFVYPSEVLDTLKACLRVFMDFGDYKHLAINRFRMLVNSMGVDRVREEMQRRAPFRFRPAGEDLWVCKRFDHVGVYEQKQDGLTYVGLNVPVGRMRGKDLIGIADLAEKYGSKDLRTTHRQNIMIINVKDDELKNLLEEPLVKKFSPSPTPFQRAVVACTSAPFCKFGIFDVKQKGLELAEYLDEKFKGRLSDGHPITIHISGCAASCAQPQIADIGLRATVSKSEEAFDEAFDICLGADLKDGRLGEWVRFEVPVNKAYALIEGLIRSYLSLKMDGESFGDFYRRIGREATLKAMDRRVIKKGGGE
ncbi:MAG: nitrite/sulfite reductase, partial [Nitrososphaerota archaeon]